MLTGNLSSCSDDLSVRRLSVTLPAFQASSHRARSLPSFPASPSWASQAGSSRHRITPRGLPETISAMVSRAVSATTTRTSSCTRRSASIEPSSLRIEASADDLPLEGSPTTACHSTIGSDQAGVTRTATPAPQRPARAASTACTT